MSTLISAGAAPPFPNHEDPPQPRRTTIRRPSSARASFVQQKLQTALSHAEKTSVNRSITRYRSTAAVVSFTDPATAFTYATSFMPGVHFYTFLAAKEAAPPRTARRRVSHSNTVGINHENDGNHANPRLTARKQKLKLNVPETILYGETGRAVWIYTDKEGYVQRSTEFSDKQVLDKFAECSPVIADEKHLVVYKEPMTTMSSVNHQNGHGLTVFNSQGNQLRLLNLGERAVYEAGKPAHAWMISNIEPFRDPNAPPSPSPGTAAPQLSPRPGLIRSNSSSTIATSGSEACVSSIHLVSRLCTSIQTDKSCTFVKLTERGCAAVSELNLRVRSSLQTPQGF
ncbi:hypothetical protein JG688_00008706 [Phytophthora aleatoria]|uniref:Uncharacterized protein n=1 Tax=Phytophthora aleatoria TaxID=2496075 RepID=A0A8J5MFM3_9STRA|nr:hypothetical protein JG688_00008706 [Phytophthora aleatoria]